MGDDSKVSCQGLLFYLMTMNISLNEKTTNTTATNVKQLIEELSLPENGVAVAINNKLVQHSDWTSTPLRENANVIIIKAVCGG